MQDLMRNLLLGGGGGFSPQSLFTGGVVGAFYDPSDLSTLYQDSDGTTPVTGVEQVVGLMLDKSQGLVLGPEEDPGFANYTNILTGTWLASGANYVFTDTVGGQSRPGVQWPAFTLAAGWYKITVVVASITGATQIRMDNVGATDQFLVAGANTFFANVTTLSRPRFRLEDTSTTIGDGFALTYVSVREIPGNHATSTGSARPTLSARVNLLTYSEDFTNASGWSQSGVLRTANTETAPNGTLTADTLTGNSTSNIVIWSPTSGFSSPAASYTASISIKAGTADFAVISFWGGSATNGVNLWVDVQNGVVGSNSVTAGYAFTSGTVTPEGNGWLRVVLTGSVPVSSVYFSVRLVDADGGFSYTNSNGKTLFVWGADLRPANIGVNIPSYQRIAAATDYDTNGFPFYLSFGGAQSMSTPANLDLTSTDKVTVYAGVRKLSDAAAGMLTELSANYNTNIGSFIVVAPDAAANYSFGLNGTFNTALIATTFASPITNVLSCGLDIAEPTRATEIKPRVNSSIPTLTGVGNASAGTGNFGTYPLFIGARNNASSFLTGYLYSLIIQGAAASATQLASTEAWVNQKTKAY